MADGQVLGRVELAAPLDFHVVAGPQVLEGAGVLARGGDLGHGDGLEGLLDEGEVAQDGRVHVLQDALEHEEVAAARGEESHAHLDEAHVGLGRGADPVAAHGDLGAAAEGEAEGRRDHGDLGVAHAEGHGLEVAHHLVDGGPVLGLRAFQEHGQVGPRAELLRLVVDDEPAEVRAPRSRCP